MKWKIKQKPNLWDKKREEIFLWFPAEYKGYYYWFERALVEYTWLGWRWSKSFTVIKILTESKEDEKETS